MEFFLARQPIFDRHRQSVAYELLFRSGPENFFSHADGDQASKQVIHNSLAVFDLHALTGGRKAFINITRKLLVDEQEWLAVLPPQHVALEILETIRPDAQVLAACGKLKRAGYTLALDDFVFSPEFAPLLEVADIVKVDFLQAKKTGLLAQTVALCKHSRVTMLAEKVETREDVNTALEAGFEFFQGYFYCRPEMVTRREVPGHKLSYLRFLQQVNQPGTDYDELEKIIRQEVSLSVKLLRFINSSTFSLQRKVESLRWALKMLGLPAIRRWASMLAISEMASDKPPELAATALVRARFCELLGESLNLPRGSGDLFLLGLLSTLDALVDRPLPELLGELPLSEALKTALLNGAGVPGQIYTAVLASEQGDWKKLDEALGVLNMGEARAGELYREAIAWADQVFSGTV